MFHDDHRIFQLLICRLLGTSWNHVASRLSISARDIIVTFISSRIKVVRRQSIGESSFSPCKQLKGICWRYTGYTPHFSQHHGKPVFLFKTHTQPVNMWFNKQLFSFYMVYSPTKKSCK